MDSIFFVFDNVVAEQPASLTACFLASIFGASVFWNPCLPFSDL